LLDIFITYYQVYRLKYFCTNKGRQYDKNGNLKQWWDDDVIAAFKKQAQCIVDQYSNYTIEEVELQVISFI
jgi:membrane metallo-endopeptidase-like protein 1